MSPQEIKALIDSDPTFFKPDGSDDIQADGYVSTIHLFNLLTGSYGLVDNPVPAEKVPVNIAIDDLIVAAPTALSTISEVMIIRIGEMAEAEDRAGIKAMASVLCLRNQMSSQERDAVHAAIDRTVDDPDWQAKIPAPPKCESATVELIDQALGRIS